MGKKLAYTVHVTERKPVDPKKPDGETTVGRVEVFERGQELPAWAAPFVGEHAFEDGDAIPAPIAPNGKHDQMSPPEVPGGEARDPDTGKIAEATADRPKSAAK